MEVAIPQRPMEHKVGLEVGVSWEAPKVEVREAMQARSVSHDTYF